MQMKNNMKIFLIVLVSVLLISNSNAQERRKLAQTGMKFLSVSNDARIAGMSSNFTSVFNGSTAMLYNPAGMADIQSSLDASFGNTKWLADINYLYGTVALNPFNDYYGVFGISVVAVDYGGFYETIRADNEKGYLQIGTYKPTAYSIGVGYARMLSEKFAIGANVKYVKQNLIGDGKVALTSSGYKKEKYELGVMAYDFGLIYKTGFKSLNIGMSVRNFAEEVKYIEENFQLPLTFRIGLSINAMDFLESMRQNHSLLFTVDATNSRDFEEQLAFGAEYTFMNAFSFRSGYNFPQDDGGFSMGFGLKKEVDNYVISLDYAISKYSIFDDVHRFSVRFAHR